MEERKRLGGRDMKKEDEMKREKGKEEMRKKWRNVKDLEEET
jgi:hypothetical protein